MAEIKRNRPRGERGITVRQAGDATYIGLAASIKGGGTVASSKPWDIYVADAEEDSYTLKVVPGLAGGFLATNWDDEFAGIADNELYYGKVTITTDGTNIQSCEISISNEEPAPQTPQSYSLENSVTLLFGLFYQGASYNVTNGNPIPAAPTVYMTKEKEQPAPPGLSPYELFYYLA